jgi:hypothetical protein
MKISVLHDKNGQIIAISKPVDLPASGSKFARVGMIPGEGQELLEVELSKEHEQHSLRELHEQYRVDASAKKLVKR